MLHFQSDAVEIAYRDEGQGEPILLIHGFASNSKVNWVDTSWVSVLQGAGYRIIAIDNRGHGQSEKLYNTAVYEAPFMAEDAKRLLDHLGIKQAHVMGYSMGARITAFLTMTYPQYVKSAIFAGLGYNMVRGIGGAGPIANALEAPSIDDVNSETAKTFRAFAETTGGDLKALAACIRASRTKISAEDLNEIAQPVLVAVGTEDVIAGPAQPLADLMTNAEVLSIPKRDHMRAVGDPVYKQGVLDFLQRVG
ncbi:MAG: alpha/beta hydrolase [Pseudomonadota bacterium]